MESNLPSKLVESFPVLRDKAVIDLININDVNCDLIRTRKSRDSLGGLLATISGKSRKEIDLMFENIGAQFVAVYEYFDFFERFQINSLRTLRYLTAKLVDTREGVMKLQEKTSERIIAIEQKIDTLRQNLIQRIERVDLKVEAKLEVEAAFGSLELQYGDFSPIEALKLALEKLHYGSTGNLFQLETDHNYLQNLRVVIEKNSIDYIRKTLGDGPWGREKIFTPRHLNKEAVELLLNYDSPIASAVYHANRYGASNLADPKDDQNLPFLFTPEVVGKYALSEIFSERQFIYG